MIKHGIFRLTIMNGELIGVYTNEMCMGKWYTESTRRHSVGSGFIGTYDSYWLEGTGNPFHTTLHIANIPGNPDIIQLNWTGTSANFTGIGLIENNALVGHYWSI